MNLPTTDDRALVIAKPDAVRRGLIGQIIARIETRGYRILAAEMRRPDRALLAEHYIELRDKPFIGGVLDFMSSGPVLPMVVGGVRVTEGLRRTVGATDPSEALPGSIRGDLGRTWEGSAMQNLVHCSDSPASATREIALWFPALQTETAS